MKDKQKEKNKKPHIKIRMFFLVLGLLFLCVTISIGTNLQLYMQRWVFVILIILAMIGSILLYWKGKFFLASGKCIFLILFIYGLVYGFLGFKLFQMENHTEIMNGSNVNVFTYQNDIFAKGYSSVDEVLHNIELYPESQEFYRYEDENCISVFYNRPSPKNIKSESIQEKDSFYMSLKVISIDIYREKDRYYYIGRREMSAACMDNYTDEETVRADLSASLKKLSVLPKQRKTFVWGLSRYSQMDKVTVDSAYCTKIISLPLRDGSTGYFWLINDMDINMNPKTVQIHGFTKAHGN